MPGALVGLGERVDDDGDLDVEDRRAHRRADERGVALVVGVGDEGDAADDELGPRRVDHHVAVGAVERQQVVRAGALAVLDLGLGDGRAVVDVPHRRGVGAVGLAAGQVVQERLLARAPADVVDRLVLQRPVVGEPEPAEEVLEDGLVGGRQLVAQLDEVRPRDRDLLVVLRGVATERWLQVGVERLRRVAADAVVVLHAALGGQPVVVPADREEHGLAGHPALTGDGVGLGVAEHRAHVDRTGDRRRRRVDGEHVGALGGAVEAVDAIGLPPLGPARLDAVQRRLLRDLGHRTRIRRRHLRSGRDPLRLGPSGPVTRSIRGPPTRSGRSLGPRTADDTRSLGRRVQ